MDFEEKLYQIARRKAEVQRRRFIRKHGPVDKMDKFPRAIYERNLANVSKATIENLNKRMNCGGYALEIDGGFLPNGDSLSGYVSAILDRYSFVRLLGDTPLQDDEYLVFYRYIDYEKNNGQNKGHHFIKVNDDGLVVEKFGSETPQIFKGWDERYANSPEVTFAVKKDHDNEINNDIDSGFNWLRLHKGLDFEGSALQSILKKSNQFEYHGHKFNLKKTAEKELFVTDEKGVVVAEVRVEGENIAVGIREGKEDYVENFSGPVKPIIENGRLVNLDEFKKEKAYEDKER